MIDFFKVSKKGLVKRSFSSFNSQDRFLIDVIKPKQDELKLLNSKLKVSLGDLRDSLDSRELPRLDQKKDYTFIILKVISNSTTATLGIFLSKNFLLVIHKEGIKSVKTLNKTLDKFSFKDGCAYICYKLISEIIKEYSASLDKLGDNLDKLEDHIFKRSNDSDLGHMFSLKKELLFLRKSLNANTEVLHNLEKIKSFSKIDDFNDMYLEMKQLLNTQEIHRERLTEIMDLYMTSVSNKLNDVMKGFTVIASLLLLPMLISGIWGMNFANIPWFDSHYGFYFPLAIMLVSVFLMLLFFKKKGWV